MKSSLSKNRLWRCLGVSGDELVFVSPNGKRFGARVDKGRLDGEAERWLRRIPSRFAGGYRMVVPREWYRKENPDAKGNLLGLEITKPDGTSVTLEFFRGLPPGELVVDYNLESSAAAAREKELESWPWETGTSLRSLAGLMSRSRRVREALSRSR